MHVRNEKLLTSSHRQTLSRYQGYRIMKTIDN
jgi:hypothetical protein